MLETMSRKSDTAGLQYALTLWSALKCYTDDGRIVIDSSAAERALRGIAVCAITCLPIRRLADDEGLRLLSPFRSLPHLALGLLRCSELE
jgi:hypothetical protein